MKKKIIYSVFWVKRQFPAFKEVLYISLNGELDDHGPISQFIVHNYPYIHQILLSFMIFWRDMPDYAQCLLMALHSGIEFWSGHARTSHFSLSLAFLMILYIVPKLPILNPVFQSKFVLTHKGKSEMVCAMVFKVAIWRGGETALTCLLKS